MPIYEVTGPGGVTLQLEGDAPPSESDLDSIFAKASRPSESLMPATSFSPQISRTTPLQDIQRDFPESRKRVEESALNFQNVRDAFARAEALRSIGGGQQALDVERQAGILPLENAPPQLPEVTAQELQTLGVPRGLARPIAGVQQGVARAGSALLTPEGAIIAAAPEAAIPAMATFIPGMLTGGAEELGAGLGEIAGGDTESGAARTTQGLAMLGAPALPALHEALRKPTTKGVANASRIESPAEVHGDLRAQPIEGEGQLPVEGRGNGVRPQGAGSEPARTQVEPHVPEEKPAALIVEPGKFTPVLQTETGEIYPGASHSDAQMRAITSLKQQLADGKLTKDQMAEKMRAVLMANLDDAQHKFVDSTGKVLTRAEAGEASGLGGEAQSHDLAKAGLLQEPTYAKPEVSQLDQDIARYDAIQAEQKALRVAGKQIVNGELSPESLALQTETEAIKNRYGGKTPKPGMKPSEQPAWQAEAPTQPTPTESPAAAEDLELVGAVDPQTGNLMRPGPGALTAGTEGVGTGEGADIYGIAKRVREQRAAAGQVADVPPGEGISAPDSVERGRALLKQGRSPENTLDLFEKTKALSADDIAVVRAHGENLARNARLIEESAGTESPEYQAAKDKLSDWDRRSKAMQTEWSKIGQAQQGETDIDTGSFTGLQRAYEQDTGKEFTPDQKQTAKETAGKVRKATVKANEAETNLVDHLDRETGGTNAEKRALAAASKTVRENAIRIANAEAKARIAKTVAERERAKEELKAAQRAQDIATRAAKDAAVKLAKAETEARVNAAQAPEDLQAKAAQDALDAASETVRKAAVRAADAESKARVAETQAERDTAQVQLDAANKALAAAQKVARDAAVRAAKADAENRLNPEKRVWQKVKDYLDAGELDFNEIRNRVATDLGMPVKKVTDLLTQNKRTKYLADEVWKSQESLRRFQQQAKRWIKSTALPGYQRALAAIPRSLFALKVGFHGTVALGTHAPMVAFQPPFWATYVRDFAKMYKMVASPKFYEMEIQDLVRRKNYITARRAGLVNDPSTYEDYNSPTVSQYFGNLSGMGNRGYAVLKILRQDMFDQHWNALPRTLQFPEMAKQIADGVNHATGVVKGAAPKGSNVVFFAPRLEASRVMWLLGDPLIAADTFARWNKATAAEKNFATQQVKEKAWVAGTLFGLLALNQGVLTATDSKQKINFTDPLHSDFLKFKAAGMTASYGNAMITMARLPVRLYQIRSSDGGKLRNVVYPDEDSYSVLGEYARSQLSPFASLATTVWLKGDWQNRPLPSSDRPVPKRLREQGVKPYTWTEFYTEQALPIPFEEAAREVWKHGMGMTDEQVASMRKAMATIAVMGATGARLVDDVTADKRKTLTPVVKK